jgi:hypothetical protein
VRDLLAPAALGARVRASVEALFGRLARAAQCLLSNSRPVTVPRILGSIASRTIQLTRTRTTLRCSGGPRCRAASIAEQRFASSPFPWVRRSRIVRASIGIHTPAPKSRSNRQPMTMAAPRNADDRGRRLIGIDCQSHSDDRGGVRRLRSRLSSHGVRRAWSDDTHAAAAITPHAEPRCRPTSHTPHS